MLRDIFFFIAPLLRTRFSVHVKRFETAMSNPMVETLKVRLKIAVSTRTEKNEMSATANCS